jgi:hypothetical protein
MTNMRLLSILVLLLLISSIEACDAAARKKAARRRKKLRARKKAEAEKEAIETNGETVGTAPDAAGDAPGPGAGVVTPVGVTPIGGGSGPDGLRPYAPAYAGFFCGPPEKGEQGIMEKCNDLPVCKFKRIDDGAAGKVITGELEGGQGDCMRRCDTRFGLSEEVNCGPGEKCHSFVMGCPCNSLSDEECHPYED